MCTQKKGLPLQIDWTPTECLTLGVSFEPKSVQYSDETREVALYYLCRSNASEGESCWEEEPGLEEHLMHVKIGSRRLERKVQVRVGDGGGTHNKYCTRCCFVRNHIG